MLTYETHVTPGNETHGTPLKRTRRTYKPRARRCKTCGDTFTPKSKHGAYCSDKCRKKAWRDRVARSKAAKPQPAKEEQLELLTCPTCGHGFFAPAGKGQRHCSPSCRTKAWRQRRAAAVEALACDMGITYDKASDVVEQYGMKKTGEYLGSRGYVFDVEERVWLQPIQV
jgi:hypothetical protein